ncbi:MAG: N-acetyltransferase family protein [Pseudomonadota bacterium]
MDIIPATHLHATGIADIWNHYIRASIATFNSAEKTPKDIALMINVKMRDNCPFFVAVLDGNVVGFATYGPFRSGVGYARVAEHTIQLHKKAFGKGIGRALMTQLEKFGKEHGLCSFFAGISGENSDAVKFHTALGFEHVADIPSVGWKFDRWHDLILMRKDL